MLGTLIDGLTAPALAVIGLVGAFTATGVLGRVMRNHPAWLAWGMLLATLGALFLIAERTLDERHRRLHRALIGAGLLGATVGLSLVALAAIRTASESERPMVSVEIDEGSAVFSANVTVGSVPSDRRLIVMVDGLARGKEATPLFQAYVGANGEGEATLPVRLPVPQDTFDAIGQMQTRHDTRSES